MFTFEIVQFDVVYATVTVGAALFGVANLKYTGQPAPDPLGA